MVRSGVPDWARKPLSHRHDVLDDMKITDITSHPFEHGRQLLIVKVETDCGLVGWGESGLTSRELAVQGVIDHFAAFLQGRDPRAIGKLWQQMYRSQYFEGGRTLTAAISALDMAFHDVKAKDLGVPVYELLGGRHREWIPGFIDVPAPTDDESIETACERLDEGWEALRVGFAHPDSDDPEEFDPRRSLAPTAEGLVRLREEIGSDPLLGLDYHHRLTVPQTISFCERLPAGTLDFLEEPIRAENPDAYESLRHRVSVPLAIGEEFANKWAVRPFLDRGLTDFVRIDLGNIGGFTEAMKVAGWAEAGYVDLMPHNPLGPVATAATAQFCAAVPNFSYLEIRPDLEQFDGGDLFELDIERDGPRLYPSESPGLGVRVDEEALAAESFAHTGPRFLHRPDGSVQNW